MEHANILKLRRLELDLTVVELSKRSGINRNLISQLENGVAVKPTTRTLIKLATALEIPVSDLYYLIGG
jgi:transcriptional regulator with XRE-family HTH domain